MERIKKLSRENFLVNEFIHLEKEDGFGKGSVLALVRYAPPENRED
jgi:hypothetical protein